MVRYALSSFLYGWGRCTMQAMILAAGFGTRLRPYTRICPKPLFPLFNRPLLLFTIDHLKSCGFSRIIVNCHHLKEQIVAAVSDIEGVLVQEEECILGTGGGLRRALSLLDDEPLLITNGDIYHTIDLRHLYFEHFQAKEQNRSVTLAVHDYPRFNTIVLDHGRMGSFSGAQKGGNVEEKVAFTGVHVVQPEILEPIVEGKESCIIDRYRQLVQENPEQFNLVRVDSDYWCDMGTPADYLALQGDLLCGRVPRIPEMAHYVGERIRSDHLYAQSEHVPADLRVEDWACIGDARIGKNVTVRRSIIWDGVCIEDNAVIEDSIVAKEGCRE